jgi:hypothetical protein
LREGDDGSHLRFVTHWYPYTRRYSPKLLEVTPFRFVSDPALTELDPRTCYTDTHGYTEVVMATAALLG